MVDELKLASWNILSTERIVNIDESRQYGNDQYLPYERRYLAITDTIISMFNQRSVDIIFIQEADEKFLNIFNFKNKDNNKQKNRMTKISYIHHFIKSPDPNIVNICLMIIYNSNRFSPMGHSNNMYSFDNNFINMCEVEYNTDPRKFYPFRCIPLFLYNKENNSPLFLINIHNIAKGGRMFYGQILQAIMRCFHDFKFISQNIPVIIGGDLYLTFDSLKMNLPRNFMVDEYGNDSKNKTESLVTGNSVHPFNLNKSTQILTYTNDKSPVTDILMLHNPSDSKCLEKISDNTPTHFKEDFKSPYDYNNLVKNNQYTTAQLQASIVMSNLGSPYLHAPFSDHNMIITVLRYQQSCMDIITFKQHLFYYIFDKTLITDPYNLTILSSLQSIHPTYFQKQIKSKSVANTSKKSQAIPIVDPNNKLSNQSNTKAGSKKKKSVKRKKKTSVKRKKKRKHTLKKKR